MTNGEDQSEDAEAPKTGAQPEPGYCTRTTNSGTPKSKTPDDEPTRKAPDPQAADLPPKSPEDIEPKESTDPATHPPDRRTTVWLSLAGAILTLIGVGLGSAVTYLNNNATIKAQQEQSVEQYRRDQRIDIYANILKEVSNLQNALENARFQLIVLSPRRGGQEPPPEPDTTPQLGKIQSDWQAACGVLDGTISNAELFSSAEVIGLAMAMRDKLSNEFYDSYRQALPLSAGPAADAFADAVSQLGTITSPYGGVPGSQPLYDKSLLDKSPNELREMYIHAAKQDLGLND